MSHKDEMEYLRENDPILFYELTSDPTGASSGGSSSVVLLVCLAIILTTITLAVWL
jgi:hypothetical protein